LAGNYPKWQNRIYRGYFFYHGLPQPFTDSELQSVLIREISGWFLRKMGNTTVD
jgi:hypothetical protein